MSQEDAKIPAGEIPLDKVFDEKIKYIWIDEDGARVSPIHQKFSAALSFAEKWSENHDRIERKAAEAQEKYDQRREQHERAGRQPDRNWELERFEREVAQLAQARAKLTITGKPPAELRRLIVHTRAAMPDDTELALATRTLEEAKINNA